MLKNIPPVLSPELFKVLMEMGHSDRIILADANYPAKSNANLLIRADGVEIPELLEAILGFFPLDTFVTHPVALMKNNDKEPLPEIWRKYREIIHNSDEENAFQDFAFLERLDFYAASKSAYAIVATSTTDRYANICLQKGVI